MVQTGSELTGVENVELAVFTLNKADHQQAAATFIPFIRN
jgi:hypothetical protein